jgi:hypothetical protein
MSDQYPPPDETQTDSQSSSGEIEVIQAIEFCSSPTYDSRDNNTPSTPLLTESNANEIVSAAVDFLSNLLDNEAKVIRPIQ